MVNRAIRPAQNSARPFGRIAVCCLALSLAPACAYLPFTDNDETTGSGNTTIPVTIEGVPKQLESGALKSVEIRAGEPTSLLDVRRRATQAASALEEYLASEGYFMAVVSPDLVEDMDMRPQLDVDVGERFTIAEINLSGTETLPADVLDKLSIASDELGIGT
ncbi:MAG TPA: hypothetical protein DDX09_02890, partial [Hyphomonas atlantica]|nr:hypothetical protein [Hyphomonas atlantica]